MSQPLGRSLDRVVALLGVALIIATGVLLIAHGNRGSANNVAQSAPAKDIDHVQIRNFVNVPAAITVPAGTTVAFTNDDNAPHTATSGTSPTSDGVFDSGTLTKGDSKTVKLTKPGTFAYYCAIHPFMKATVTIK
jgi:plastocyanin